MSTSPLLSELLGGFLSDALSKMESYYKDDEITDFYIRLDSSCRHLTLSDDNDQELSRVDLPPSLLVDPDVDDDIYEDLDGTSDETPVDPDQVLHSLRPYLVGLLSEMNRNDSFSHISVFRPFSFVLGDDDMMEDLLVVDDSSMILGDDLLKDIEEDLDSFIENLLK